MARKKKGETPYIDLILPIMLEILKQEPNGIRFLDLSKKVKESFSDFSQEMVNTYVNNAASKSSEIVKPSRGFYMLKQYASTKETDVEDSTSQDLGPVKHFQEEEFYESFCNYLTSVLDECVEAIPLGGRRFKDKWVTPDVIGFYTIQKRFAPFNTEEIVTAEIKVDLSQVWTAFGQACSYKLFSHKVYLVIPLDCPVDDYGRIESLCIKFGLGLVQFNRFDKEEPDFAIRTRAIKSEPDYFYLNIYLAELTDEELNKLQLLNRSTSSRKN